jgi:hypothetical protein
MEAALFGALVAVVVTAGVARAQEPTPGVTVAPPPTPHPNAPAAPSELRNVGGVVSWTDNSDNEDRFRLTHTVSGSNGDLATVVYEIAANASTFALPPDAPRQSCPDYTAQFLKLVAYNESGDSSPALFSTVADCNPPVDPNAPNAPTDLFAADGEIITWTDNSDNEDGFRITRRVYLGSAPDRTDRYEVGPNVTGFSLPADAPRLCGDGGYQAFDLTIVAFNDLGVSPSDQYGVGAECGGLAPSDDVTLPSTGLGGAETSWRSLWVQMMVASAAVVVVIGVVGARVGRRR